MAAELADALSSAHIEQSDQPAWQGDKQTGSKDDRDLQESSTMPSPSSSDNRRGRSRTRTTPHAKPEDYLKRRGYHTLMSSFGKAFHVEKRWKLIREMGSGAYGYVISAADEISGEPVAIKMVTRATEKIQLAKRALREIVLLRHFSHENITGLIDVDCTPNLDEIYIFMEPMEADLHQIIKSGQALTNEHVQYFLYQILRGMKYIHSASVIHRDLKPGNLLVNADCELKICDFGLARGFNSAPDEPQTNMTEYVATRWYRAPEIMLAFKAYDTAIDVWSIGCIFAELMMGRPLFKGKDYVDQLNQILQVLGTPENEVIKRIASSKAAAYIRSLPFKKTVPFTKVIPTADPPAADLLTKMLAFDPAQRISVAEALEHPYLTSYHDTSDEPACPVKFERWRYIESLETLEQFRDALWTEIQDYRREVRSTTRSPSVIIKSPDVSPEKSIVRLPSPQIPLVPLQEAEEMTPASEPAGTVTTTEATLTTSATAMPEEEDDVVDPVVTYSRRSSMFSSTRPSRTNSSYSIHSASQMRGIYQQVPEAGPGLGGESSVLFPTQEDVYVKPRSRTSSMFAPGQYGSRRLLRTLSTVSIYESGEGLAGGLADIAPIGKYIHERDEPLPSGKPRELESAASSPEQAEGEKSQKAQ